MYRGGLDEELDQMTSFFVSSLQDDIAIIPFDIAATEAHVLMLYHSKIIPKADAKKILSALRQIRTSEPRSLMLDPNFEDCHEMLESMVVQLAGKRAGGRMQTGRSRNDQVAVAIRLKLLHDTDVIQAGILQLVTALFDMASDHTDTMMPLYTHLQHAQTGVLSHYFLAHASALIRDYERFSGVYARLDSNPLGSGPVGGSSLNIDRDATTDMLGFSDMVYNSLDATSSRDYISEFISCVAIMCINLSRMAEDLVLWTSDEFGFVEIGDHHASPSSAMPQKKNPDVLEIIRGKAAATVGDLVAVLSAQKGLASGYGRDLQETKAPAGRASIIAIGSLTALFNVLTSMTINEKRMAQATESGNIIALDVAEALVANKVPFREAHLSVGKLATAARRAGKQMREMTRVEISGACSLDPNLVDGILAKCTVEGSANRRRTQGSPSSREQMSMMRYMQEELDVIFEEHRAHSVIDDRIGKMREEIDSLLDR